MHVLFLCRDNSSRSQIAEGLARQMLSADIRISSAGIEAGTLHPLAIATMREIQIDIASQRAKTLTDIPEATAADLVVIICERDISEGHLPKSIKRLHWPIMDPAEPPASEKELVLRFRDVRMAISKHLKDVARMRQDRL